MRPRSFPPHARPPGYHEADVPIILSRPVSDECARRAEDARLHSYEAFDYAFNGVVG